MAEKCVVDGDGTVNSEAPVFFGIPVFIFLPGAGDDDVSSVLYGYNKSDARYNA